MPEDIMGEITKQMQLLAKRALDGFGLELTIDQINYFIKYTFLLLEWNEKINLTAITDPEDIVIKHFLDSLVFVQWINHYYKTQRIKVGDLGTGAGFPGIPIKIVLPDVELILIDALAKRITFLNEVIKALNLAHVETIHSRAEDIGRDPEHREGFDLLTARAVAELPVLLEYASPLLRVGGRLFAAKGVDPEDEINSAQNALRLLNCEVEHLVKYRLADGADHRSLIIIKKVAATPAKYPRQAGKPKKNPL